MDQTIRLRSSHVGVSRCLNSDGKVLKSIGPRTAKLPYRYRIV